MRDPLVIGPDDARIVSVEAGPVGTTRLVDLTDLSGADAGHRRFVLVGDVDAVGSVAALAQGADGAALVALVASPAIAEQIRDGGWTSPIVVEVGLDEQAVDRIAALRAAGTLAGVVVAPMSSAGSDGSGTTPIGTEVAAAIVQGRALGLLTAVMLAGVSTVRTADPASARRVRAVVAALVGSGGLDARMGR